MLILDMLKYITNQQIYEEVIGGAIPQAAKFVWIATADIKDLYVDKKGQMVPFLEVLSDLVKKKLEIRLLHAKEPGPNFRKDFDRYPNLIKGIERVLCPRVHFKAVVVDGSYAYSGSANLTGAGMGAKSKDKRNFEAGFVTTEPEIIAAIMDQFDGIWSGTHCKSCKRKTHCADYKDMLAK
jgi:phosphatidylserine/phosphatidylglycerophosphate/cardiolipin synthase-like enzyme